MVKTFTCTTGRKLKWLGLAVRKKLLLNCCVQSFLLFLTPFSPEDGFELISDSRSQNIFCCRNSLYSTVQKSWAVFQACFIKLFKNNLIVLSHKMSPLWIVYFIHPTSKTKVELKSQMSFSHQCAWCNSCVRRAKSHIMSIYF